MKPFKEDYRITQLFGANPDIYKKYGFKGHEGLDLVPKSGSWDLLSMEDGEVVRDVDVPRDNYGRYCVIINWDKKRAWWYCHMATNNVKVGQTVKAGEKIGMMGNTGYSTGAHLHLGLRHCDANGKAINTNNGYKGFVDPLPLVKELTMTQSKELTACLEAHTSLMTQLDAKGKEIASLSKRLSDSETVRKELGKSLEQLSQEHVDSLNEITNWQRKLETASDKLSKVTEQFKLLEEEHLKVMAERTQYRRYYDKHRAMTGLGLIIEGLRRVFRKDA